MFVLNDVWHCLPRSALHTNTNYTFPNKVLPVIDHSLSLMGALINLLLLLAIYVKRKRSGTMSSSSIFCVSICFANLIECANSILLYASSKSDGRINYCLFIATGVQGIVHSVKVGSMMPIFIIRLLFVVSLSSHRERCGRKWEKTYCYVFWVSATVVGGIRTYLRIEQKKARGDQDMLENSMTKISFCLIMANGLVSFFGQAVSFTTVSYVMKIFLRYRPSKTSPDPHATCPAVLKVTDKDNAIYNSIKSRLQVLIILFTTDLVFGAYHFLLAAASLKIYFTPGCYPEVFVKIRNYLGTTTNFLYSYHCLGVLHGICICIIFLVQKTMKHTVRFMWKVDGMLVIYMAAKWRRRREGDYLTTSS